MNIVIINGAPQVGKDTFVNFCKNLSQPNFRVFKFSTVDLLKEISKKYFYWNGEKTPISRKFLSDFKNLVTDFNDVPLKYCLDRIEKVKEEIITAGESTDKTVIFIMTREPEEIDKFKKILKYPVYTLAIRNEEIEKQPQSNSADINALNYTYDFVINNNGTLTELNMVAIQFLSNFWN